jgi:L-lactate dehydrogenase complex protein LldG
MTARDEILGRIRAATGRTGAVSADAPPPPEYANASLIPARATGTTAELTARFVEMATEAAATVDRVATPGEVGAAIAAWLTAANLPRGLVVAPDPAMDIYGLDAADSLTVQRRAATGADLVSVTPVRAGVAETGSLMVTAAPGTPYTLNFLPEIHIAVLHADQIVGGYEDAWAIVRRNNETGSDLPRTVTLITGPSRSSDIERTVTIGVHGPKQLHIVLVGKADGEED